MLDTKISTSKKSIQKSAFSLIELSIVLVIIGILVAGVIGGISLMKGAGLRAAMTEARAFGTAANSFNAQYDLLPGDYKTVIGTSGIGDGDGLIEYVNDAGTPAAEGIIAWQHLINSGMIESTFTPVTTNIATAAIIPSNTTGSIIPGSKIKGSGWAFDKIINSDGTTYTDSFVILTGTIPVATTTTQIPIVASITANPLTAIDALAIDTKIDDSYPVSGRVRIPAALGSSAGTTPACFDNNTPANKGSYSTAVTGTTCAVGFQVSQ